jgi:hypothetical protein
LSKGYKLFKKRKENSIFRDGSSISPTWLIEKNDKVDDALLTLLDHVQLLDLNLQMHDAKNKIQRCWGNACNASSH